MSNDSNSLNPTLAIHPQETILFASAARHGKASKEFMLEAIHSHDITPAALRILRLIYGETVKEASAAERDMAWYYVGNLPAKSRLMKRSSLDRRKSVYRSRTARKKKQVRTTGKSAV